MSVSDNCYVKRINQNIFKTFREKFQAEEEQINEYSHMITKMEKQKREMTIQKKTLRRKLDNKKIYLTCEDCGCDYFHYYSDTDVDFLCESCWKELSLEY